MTPECFIAEKTGLGFPGPGRGRLRESGKFRGHQKSLSLRSHSSKVEPAAEGTGPGDASARTHGPRGGERTPRRSEILGDRANFLSQPQPGVATPSKVWFCALDLKKRSDSGDSALFGAGAPGSPPMGTVTGPGSVASVLR